MIGQFSADKKTYCRGEISAICNIDNIKLRHPEACKFPREGRRKESSLNPGPVDTRRKISVDERTVWNTMGPPDELCCTHRNMMVSPGQIPQNVVGCHHGAPVPYVRMEKGGDREDSHSVIPIPERNPWRFRLSLSRFLNESRVQHCQLLRGNADLGKGLLVLPFGNQFH